MLSQILQCRQTFAGGGKYVVQQNPRCVMWFVVVTHAQTSCISWVRSLVASGSKGLLIQIPISWPVASLLSWVKVVVFKKMMKTVSVFLWFITNGNLIASGEREREVSSWLCGSPSSEPASAGGLPPEGEER